MSETKAEYGALQVRVTTTDGVKQNLCEHGNYHCLICEVKLLEIVIKELKEENEKYWKTIGSQYSEILGHQKQAQKMKEVLQFYGDWENYVWYETNDDPFDFPHQKVDDDKGAKARSILAEMEEST